MGERAATDLKTRPGWQRIEAIQQHKICSFSPDQSDIVVRSGPRISEAADLMVACLKRLYPE
jgi:iron complex transport system substrate-binding protein